MASRKLLKSIFDKGQVLDMDYINFILNAASSSCKAGVIHLPESVDKGKPIRANINALLIAPFGSGKSSSVADVSNSVKAIDVTAPGLIGTISRDGQLNEGAIAEAAGKVLIIDECQKLGIRTKESMNSIMEYPFLMSRKLGFKLMSEYDSGKKNRYYRLEASNGSIKVYARFSTIAIGTEIKLKMRDEKAWASRFMIGRIEANAEHYMNILKGKTSMVISPEEYSGNFIMDDETKYFSLVDYYKEQLQDTRYWDLIDGPRNQEGGYTIRNFGDMVRLSCWIDSIGKNRKYKKESYPVDIKLCKRMIDKYMRISLHNAFFGALPISDYLLCKYPHLTWRELVKLPGLEHMTESTISQRTKKLKGQGLIGEVESEKSDNIIVKEAPKFLDDE